MTMAVECNVKGMKMTNLKKKAGRVMTRAAKAKKEKRRQSDRIRGLEPHKGFVFQRKDGVPGAQRRKTEKKKTKQVPVEKETKSKLSLRV